MTAPQFHSTPPTVELLQEVTTTLLITERQLFASDSPNYKLF